MTTLPALRYLTPLFATIYLASASMLALVIAAPTTVSSNADSAALQQRQRLLQQLFEASLRNDDNAVLDWRNMIEEQPYIARGQRKEARKLNSQGLALLAKNDFAAALEQLEAAQQADPADAEISNNYGYALYKAGRLPAAFARLQQTLALAPARAAAWGNLGDVYASLELEKEAIACYQNAYRFSRAADKTLAYFKHQQQDSATSANVKQALERAIPLLAGNRSNDGERGAAGFAPLPPPSAALLTPPAPTAPPTTPGPKSATPSASAMPYETVNQNNPQTLFRLAKSGNKDALRDLHKLAEGGNSMAQYLSGVAHENGYATLIDPSIAVSWYKRAVAQNLSQAQFALAYANSLGLGVEQDAAEAARLYKLAAEQGNAAAQNNLGVMYARGQGVALDFVQACNWYQRAAEQNDPWAQVNLGRAYQAGKCGKVELEAAAKLFTRAASTGYAAGQFKLAQAIEYGSGIAKDVPQAIVWYKKAAEQGLEPARDALKRLNALD